ncbi:MAG: 16S rRNA (cytidine(1402)-2'-O)-methyltransferase [bacterium]|nr:16S rRNA (cytidine(1402)-2'-O)-methyltransferase [bacterium]
MGTLYLVATPIGNLGDITLRAIETLKMVDVVACEDTRRTGLLLQHLSIKKPLLSYYEENEDVRVPEIMNRLKSGQSIALVTDGGTPCISDPGFPLVRAAIAEGISITSIPGPSALLSALILSGLPTHHFLFLGFLPQKHNKRHEVLTWARLVLEGQKLSVVLYIPPHRLETTLEEIKTILGNRSASLARELTKIHEEVIRGSISDLQRIIVRREKMHQPLKGEMVLVIS